MKLMLTGFKYDTSIHWDIDIIKRMAFLNGKDIIAHNFPNFYV